MTEWPSEFLQNWDPKRDFSYAMLHAERLIRILVDEAISEILLEQAKEYPERRDVLERYLERAEPRCRYQQDMILSTGERLLERLAESDPETEREAIAWARNMHIEVDRTLNLALAVTPALAVAVALALSLSLALPLALTLALTLTLSLSLGRGAAGLPVRAGHGAAPTHQQRRVG